MKNCLITFRSVTPAQRAESALKRAGIPCTLQRTPKWMEEQGCGYSLTLKQVHLQSAAELLRTYGIAYRKGYLRRENGMYEEVQL